MSATSLLGAAQKAAVVGLRIANIKLGLSNSLFLIEKTSLTKHKMVGTEATESLNKRKDNPKSKEVRQTICGTDFVKFIYRLHLRVAICRVQVN